MEFLDDLRYGLRGLRKNRGFAGVAVVSLALGIGANTTIFTLLNAIFLRPLAVRDAAHLAAELYHHTLAVPRLRRLALRVEMVAMAEDGASFLDVYRFLTATHGMPARDAYLDAARIFRGGLLEGGAPFTKDACYLAGLVEVHAFLAAFVRAGFRDECEMLVCGRFALEDIAALVELRAMGILSRPHWRPRWLRDWGTLLPHFAFRARPPARSCTACCATAWRHKP